MNQGRENEEVRELREKKRADMRLVERHWDEQIADAVRRQMSACKHEYHDHGPGGHKGESYYTCKKCPHFYFD